MMTGLRTRCFCTCERPINGVSHICVFRCICAIMRVWGGYELALVQCFAIRFLTNPKTIMQS